MLIPWSANSGSLRDGATLKRDTKELKFFSPGDVPESSYYSSMSGMVVGCLGDFIASPPQPCGS